MSIGENIVKQNDLLDSEISKISLKFLKKLKDLLPQVELFFTLLNSGSIDPAAIANIRNQFHQLAGSGKIFGFPEVGKAAGHIDDILEKLQKHPEKNLQKEIILELKKFLPEFLEATKKALNGDAVVESEQQAVIKKPIKKQYKIFSVDDDSLVSDFLEKNFAQEGCQVIKLERGSAVFEKLKTDRPDLIILDVDMPEMSGIEVLKQLKSDPQYKNLPVILLTKLSNNKDILSGLSFGAIDYITKPFDISDLMTRALTLIKSQKVKILAIDDDELLVEVIEQKLMKKGYKFLKCYNGNDALKIVDEQKPDLIILDIMLPGTDGITILKHIQKNPATASIPVIVLTAKKQQANIVKCLENGAYECITKPFDLEELTIRIEAILHRNKAI